MSFCAKTRIPLSDGFQVVEDSILLLQSSSPYSPDGPLVPPGDRTHLYWAVNTDGYGLFFLSPGLIVPEDPRSALVLLFPLGDPDEFPILRLSSALEKFDKAIATMRQLQPGTEYDGLRKSLDWWESLAKDLRTYAINHGVPEEVQ